MSTSHLYLFFVNFLCLSLTHFYVELFFDWLVMCSLYIKKISKGCILKDMACVNGGRNQEVQFRVILTKYSHQFQLCLLNIVCFGLPTECHLARSHLLDFSCAVQKNLVFLGEKCGRKVWISYLSLHIGGMILCPTEKSVPVQGFCCYQWCEAISWSEILGRPIQKSGPGEQEETLGNEE